MNRKYKIMIAGVGAMVVVAAAASTAYAASKIFSPAIPAAQASQIGITPGVTIADYQAWGCPVANGNYEAIAKLLGMTVQDLQTQLDQGQSLAEITAGKGVSVDKLVAAILDPMKAFMQQQVTSGSWTQAQMDSHLQVAEQHVRQLVNLKGNDADDYYGCGGGPATARNAAGQTGTYRGMMGGGYSGMMGGSSGGMMGGSYGGMMGSWY